MSCILVMGGAGFIGGHVMMALRAAGHDAVAFDNFSNSHKDQLLGAPFIEGDITNPEDVERAFAQGPFDAVFHFAALIDAGLSVRQPDIFHHVNTGGVAHLLAAMKHHDVRRLIFSSTAAVYGNPQYVPIDEHHPVAPINPYGESKANAEKLIATAHAEWDLDYVVLRYFNAAGSDPQGRIGERHDPETHLIPLAIDATLERRAPLSLFGDDYDTPDGTCIRDYVHVCDLADAHMAALNTLMAEQGPLTVNLGTGNGFSVREVIDAVSDVMGAPVPHTMAPRRPGDPAVLVCSNERAKDVLNWSPAYTDLKDIIRHAADFRRKQDPAV